MTNQIQSITTQPQTYIPLLDVATHFNLEKRTTVLLHPRRHTVPDPFASKLGGHFAWPADEPWPQCSEHGDSFAAILQLTKNDVPELEFPEGKDLFQLLWCPDNHDNDTDGPKIYVTCRAIDEINELMEKWTYSYKPEFCTDHLPEECRLFPERLEETDPHVGEERVEQIDKYILENGQNDLDTMQVPSMHRDEPHRNLFSAAPTTKVGGFICTVEDPWYPICSCGREMEYLLTVASSDIGDGCTSYRWSPNDIPRDEKGKIIFDAHSGSDLWLADMGSLHVYICRNCENWPAASFYDSE